MKFFLTKSKYKGRVLFVGQMYYHSWYLSRELRKLGWKADVLNFDGNENSQMYYHGEDFRFRYDGERDKGYELAFFFKSLFGLGSNEFYPFLGYQLAFFFKSLFIYDIFHFSNAHAMIFGNYIHVTFAKYFGEYSEIKLLKKLGKRIVYSNNSCLDGVSQTSFSQWEPGHICDACIWKNHPEVCSDSRNLAWGKIRNELADYQITWGGNRIDYNDDPHVHDVPEFYCMDKTFLNPDLTIPKEYLLPYPDITVKIYHAVGNFESRTEGEEYKNDKDTHLIIPVINKLKSEGYPVEMIFFTDIPNKKIRYYQVQADIVVDMLTAGWFGANIREAMMLGKPCVCFIRPEWLKSLRKEMPEYADELPVISATPDTVYSVLKDLIEHPERRQDIGRRSREFAVKWHSAEAGAKRLDRIYSDLLMHD